MVNISPTMAPPGGGGGSSSGGSSSGGGALGVGELLLLSALAGIRNRRKPHRQLMQQGAYRN
jgi:hypothetical protein